MATTQPPQTDFVKAISRLDATALVVGSMIGSGIFIVSAEILREVHTPGLLLLVWGLSGVVTLMGALSYGELAAMFPNAGGQYIYLREGDRKSTRLNSSHEWISYAVFCLKLRWPSRAPLFPYTTLFRSSMIGSGIFIVSAEILREVHTPGLLLLVWGLSGVVTLMGALSYGELAAMFPNAGGQYIYLRE